MAARMDLPSGTVTFLFTDIEGSTRHAKALGAERWADVLEEHRRLLREAFARHGGHEVDAEGDGFFVVFERATDAVPAALDAQRAIESLSWPGEPLRVRMELHTGEAVLRDEGYAGHDVHRAKRIADAAHGGQIVVSETTATPVSESLLEGVSLRDLGLHRLKDVDRRSRLFQLEATGLPREFPPLRSLGRLRHNLPAQRSSFVGREREIREVRGELNNHRLVTHKAAVKLMEARGRPGAPGKPGRFMPGSLPAV